MSFKPETMQQLLSTIKEAPTSALVVHLGNTMDASEGLTPRAKALVIRVTCDELAVRLPEVAEAIDVWRTPEGAPVRKEVVVFGAASAALLAA